MAEKPGKPAARRREPYSPDGKDEEMTRMKAAAVAVAAAAGLLAVPIAANAAVATPAESVYTKSSLTRCFADQIFDGCVYFQAYTTYSATQIWINGNVYCKGEGFNGDPAAPVDVTWCGVGGGNGTGFLNVGVDWNVPAWKASGLYERMDIVKNGEGCTTSGSDKPIGKITYWYTVNPTVKTCEIQP
jgi:hypothetical protein